MTISLEPRFSSSKLPSRRQSFNLSQTPPLPTPTHLGRLHPRSSLYPPPQIPERPSTHPQVPKLGQPTPLLHPPLQMHHSPHPHQLQALQNRADPRRGRRRQNPRRFSRLRLAARDLRFVRFNFLCFRSGSEVLLPFESHR